MNFAPKNILIPLSLDPEDDIDLAKSAIDTASDLARKFNSHLTLLHLASISVPPPSAGFDATGKIYETLAVILKERHARARAKLSELQKHAESRHLNVKSVIVDTPESLAHGICRVADEENVDLIVIASHSRRGLKKLFLGSVAEKVVHLSSVPVLLLPASKT